MLAPSQRRPATTQRAGFTLVELLAVIIVISILIAMLAPAVMSSFRKVRITSVRTEISQLDSAIGKFKSTYGMDPPSSIFIPETSTDWNLAANANYRAIIRQIWPQFDFSYSAYSSNQVDINGDGAFTGVTLTQGECLVFFLGGICSTNSPGVANIGGCTGFAKNPANPFARGGSREAVLFEFLPSRFTDVDNDGMAEYKDPLPGQTNPYVYFSSYSGQGYLPGEFGGTLTEPYRQGTTANAPYWKSNSYQIVSPGYDHNYGFGGAYVTTGTTRIPSGTAVSAQYVSNSFASTAPTATQRMPEADNITNFSDGELGQ
jgi:prepilin-type N-terminal cleavage/methylation domain-containing protein